MFDDLAPRLVARGLRVLAPDLRGHGGSGRLATGHAFAVSIIDLACLARDAGSPVGLVGHSMGGSISLQATAVFPELFSWSVIIDGLGPPSSMFAERDLKTHAAQAVTGGIKTLGRGSRVFESIEAMAAQRGAINKRVPQEWLMHLARHGSRANGDGFSWLWDPVFNLGVPDGFRLEWVTGDYQHVHQPTLVLMAGAADMWSDMPFAEAEERCSFMGDARLQVVEEAGHYLHLERSDHVASLIEAFLDEVQP